MPGAEAHQPRTSSHTKQTPKPAAPSSSGERSPPDAAIVLIETGPTAEATVATLANALKVALSRSDGRSVLTWAYASLNYQSPTPYVKGNPNT